MSVVYRAEHQRLGRTVALKLLAPDLAENDRFRDRLLRESRMAAALDHPNIIPIYDADEAAGPRWEAPPQPPLPLAAVARHAARAGGRPLSSPPRPWPSSPPSALFVFVGRDGSEGNEAPEQRAGLEVPDSAMISPGQSIGPIHRQQSAEVET